MEMEIIHVEKGEADDLGTPIMLTDNEVFNKAIIHFTRAIKLTKFEIEIINGLIRKSNLFSKEKDEVISTIEAPVRVGKSIAVAKFILAVLVSFPDFHIGFRTFSARNAYYHFPWSVDFEGIESIHTIGSSSCFKGVQCIHKNGKSSYLHYIFNENTTRGANYNMIILDDVLLETSWFRILSKDPIMKVEGFFRYGRDRESPDYLAFKNCFSTVILPFLSVKGVQLFFIGTFGYMQPFQEDFLSLPGNKILQIRSSENYFHGTDENNNQCGKHDPNSSLLPIPLGYFTKSARGAMIN